MIIKGFGSFGSAGMMPRKRLSGFGDDDTTLPTYDFSSPAPVDNTPTMTPGTDLSSFVPATGIPTATPAAGSSADSTGIVQSLLNFGTATAQAVSKTATGLQPTLAKYGITLPTWLGGTATSTANSSLPLILIVGGGAAWLMFGKKKKSRR